MKICYVLPKYDATAGEHVVHKYKFLSEIGKHCELAVLVEKCKGEPVLEGVKEVVCLTKKSFIPRLFETAKKITALRRKGYKKFFVHYSFFGAAACSIIARLSGAKVFYWNCGLPHLYFKSFGEKGWLSSKWNDDWPLRVSLKLVNYLVTGTERMKQYYHETFNVPLRKIKVLPNQLDLEKFKPHRPENQIPVVLFVHRMSERKGAHYLVPIAERILKNQKVKFIIAGDGPYLSTLKKSIKKKKLEKWMTTLGSVPNKEISKYYAKADAYLMPSDEEGFPNVLLESMALGCPFVASDIGGVRDIIYKGAQEFVVKKGNVDAFADKLLILLSDKKLRENLSVEGLKHVKQFDVRKISKKFVDMIKSV